MTRPSRALVIANRLPFPLDDGWKQRAYHVVRAVAATSDTTFVVFHNGGADQVAEFQASLGAPITVITVDPPKQYSWLRLLLGMFTRVPIHVWNCRSSEFRRVIRELASQQHFDVAVAELTYMYPYLRDLPPGTRRIVDTHNIDSLVVQRYADHFKAWLKRWYARMTSGKLLAHEHDVFTDADGIWVCSDREATYLEDARITTPVLVAPNGVDVPSALEERPSPTSPRVVFCGHMSYYPNVDAVLYFSEHVLPRLQATRADLEFWVVGQSPDERLRVLAANNPSIKLTGRVDDVRPYITSSSVVAVPLRVGGGTRLKILEALALGMPVVSTSVGAEGLELREGSDLLIANTPDEMTAAIERVLDSRVYGDQLGTNGRRTVSERYCWTSIEQGLGSQLSKLH